MSKIKFSGPLVMRVRSFMVLNGIGMATYARHALGKRLEPSWDANFETGIRFWRHQFTAAMRQRNLVKGRQILDSLQTETDDCYDVSIEPTGQPRGHWHIPRKVASSAVLLYFHGGGYAFHGAMSRRFASMLAHHVGARVFAPDYRLTPEHAHPAQAEDALAAWRYIAKSTPPKHVVVIGDSAGGHMGLMLLQALRSEGGAQPSLCVGLCPWTDIGDRGASLRGNDRYDLVQGWMALRFGEWLDPEYRYGRAALSPITQDYRGLAPLYLQAGGREVLRDMICDFATTQAELDADVLLDLWPDMPHDFLAYDSMKQSSRQALTRLVAAIAWSAEARGSFGPGPNTELATGAFRGG
ncbi:MAG: alpha/beta hydrolase fold domain-containing protein [Hyphomicrobiaceae bacterium]|nr:alpha/beta hydrolase fold domain-containing protein [Hyphomicrobiaceae bacterium]